MPISKPAGAPALVVIPCSGSKLWYPAPAGELYTGSWHKLARKAADRLAAEHDGSRVVVLSARHGLLPLDQVVAPYEQQLHKPGAITADQVALQLVQQLHQLPAGSGVVALLPRAYRELVELAAQRLPYDVPVAAPLAGASGVGYQRQVLAQLARP